LQREVARRQAEPQGQGADLVGDQRGEWQRQRGNRGRLCGKPHGNRLQRSLSPRYSPADPGRGRAVHARRFGLSDGGQGRCRRQRPLRPDADAGVTRFFLASGAVFLIPPHPPTGSRPAISNGGELSQTRTGATLAWLRLSDFRCYVRAELELAPRPVVLTGPNGAGKTNLLEAI